MKRSVEPLLLAVLLAATAAAYLPSIDGEFLFDDEYLLQDPLVLHPLAQGALGLLAAPRPLATLTFAANRAAVGTDTRGWHVTNVAIHLGAVLLAWLLARATLVRAGLSRPALPALAAAALFALHPLQTESVAYLIQRSEALASALYLAAFLLLLARDAATGSVRRGALLAGAVLGHGLGLLSKPIVATLPIAWLLHAALLPPPGEESLSARERVRSRLWASAPFFALSIAAAAWNLAGTRGSPTEGFDIPGLSPVQYFATQLRVVPTYLSLALWPVGQCADWDFPASAGLLELPVIGGGLFLLALVAAAVLLARRAADRQGDGPAAARAGAFGLLLFLVALAPSSSVLPLLDPLAEHRVYLGLLGLALGAAAGGAWLLRRIAGRRATMAAGAAVVALLLALGAATARRSAVWTSRLTLWSDTAERSPRKARVQLNLGSSLFFAGRFPEALEAFRRARAAGGDRTAWRDELLGNTVGTLLSMGRSGEAREELLPALRESPGSAVALGLLAQVEFEAGEDAAAEAAALRALAVDPGDSRALKYLGYVRAERGELASARALLERAAGAGNDTGVLLELASVEERLGDRRAACDAYRRAATEPGWDEVAARARAALARLGCR